MIARYPLTTTRWMKTTTIRCHGKSASQGAYDVKGRKATSKAASKTVDTRRNVSSHNDPLDPKVQLEEEKNRSPSKFNTKGKRTGYGLWYNRSCYDHSVEEMTAGQ